MQAYRFKDNYSYKLENTFLEGKGTMIKRIIVCTMHYIKGQIGIITQMQPQEDETKPPYFKKKSITKGVI